jgi:hypothetical protein
LKPEQGIKTTGEAIMSEAFDLDFQPFSYWGPQSLSAYFGGHITGELRRRGAKEEADTGSTSEDLLQPTLSDATRLMRGSIHPWFMGGEYLPPLRPNEVEIARVTLRSVTMDVFSIRARRAGKRIYYRLVDEYMEQEPPERFVVKPKWSKKLLAMSQVVSIIDENGLIDEWRDFNFDGTNVDHIFDFATAWSEFYPQLAEYYDTENEAWRVERNKELDEGSADEELD